MNSINQGTKHMADETKPKKKIRKTLFEEFLNIPNLLTLARIIVIPLICMLITKDGQVSAFIATVIYSLAALTDMVDGYIARTTQQVTLIGKFLDPLADKLIVLSILMTLLTMNRIALWVVGLTLAREITVTGLRAIASSEGMVIAARPLGKYKTAFQMIALIGLLIHYPYVINFGFYIGEFDFHRLGIVFFYISLFFSLASATDYFSGFVKEMKRQRGEH